MFQSARTIEKINKNSRDRIIPIQIRLNDTQGGKDYEVGKQIFVDQEKDVPIKKNLEEKENLKNVKVIMKKSPMIYVVEEDYGESAPLGMEK